MTGRQTQSSYEKTTKRDKINQTRNKKALNIIETQRCMNPPQEKEKWNQLFMTMGIINKKEVTIYADLTGKFPITSMNGMQAIFIMYD